MVFFLSIVFFVFGAIIASFVGVIAARLNTGQGFLTGRSRCDSCNKPLPPITLVPIVSYIMLGGRARCCGSHFSLLTPVSEGLLGILFVLSYLYSGLTLALPFFLASLAALLALVLYDLAHQILPPSILFSFIGLSAVSAFLSDTSFAGFAFILMMAFLIGMSLAVIHYASKGRAMGLSDAPLAFGLALLTGPTALAGFMFSFWIGAISGITILARRPAGSRMGIEVPFAPYLAAGFLLAYFTQWNPFAFIVGFPMH